MAKQRGRQLLAAYRRQRDAISRKQEEWATKYTKPVLAEKSDEPEE